MGAKNEDTSDALPSHRYQGMGSNEVAVEDRLELATQRGWEVHQVYSDRVSGAKERRRGLDAPMTDARRGLFDVIAVWRFDRFARSLKQLVLALEDFRSLGTEFVSRQEALDTSTPMGKVMFTVIAAMAELEGSIIRERVVAGLEHARTHKTKSGRPIGRPRAVFRRDLVAELRRKGHSWTDIARRIGLVSGLYAEPHTRLALRRLCQNPSSEKP